MSALRHAILNDIAQIWNVKSDEVELNEDGFDWQPGSHMVSLRIFRDERNLFDEERFCIIVATRYRRSAPVHDPKFVKWMGLMSRFLCPTYSLVYPPSEVARKELVGITPAISLFASAYVNAEVARWLPGLLAQMSIMQPINAEIQSSMPSERFLGAVPDFVTGSRKATTNEILDFAGVIIAPEGRKPNCWANSNEFEEFLERDGGSDACLGTPRKGGMLLGTPFGSNPAFINFRTDQSHPALGNGLLITTELRATGPYQEICDKAALLNYLEFQDWTEFPQLGCWHPHGTDEEALVAHSCFIPNAFYVPGLVAYFAFWALHRVRWARHRLLPNIPDLPIDEIL
jgi:hypothetical protein